MIAMFVLFMVSCQNSPALQNPAVEAVAFSSTDSTMYYLDAVEHIVLTPKGYTRAAAHFVAGDSIIKSDAAYLMKADYKQVIFQYDAFQGRISVSD